MNFKLPNSTYVNKFVAKNKFFQKAVINSKLKQDFTDKIQKITWKYKIAENTIWINKTQNIQEIEIFEVELKENVIPKNVLKIIDKLIPYPILYVFRYKDQFAYWITLKWENTWNYYFSNWNENIDFDFKWLNIEKVYHNIIKKFIKKTATDNKWFKEIIEIDSKISILEKEIQTLKNKITKEKQFNKKAELNKELLDKKKQLQNLLK